jgi:hypothetical protein
MDNIYMPPGHSSDELREVIETRGRENLKKYFNNALFDPDKKIIFEDIKYKLKEV